MTSENALTDAWIDLLTGEVDGEVPELAAGLPAAVVDVAGGGNADVTAGAVDLGRHRARAHNSAPTVVEDVHAIRGLIDEHVDKKARKGLDADKLTSTLEDVLRHAMDAWSDEAGRVAANRVTRDPVTGLYNRAMFSEELRRQVAGAHRSGMPSLLLADVDHFKPVNEAFGHMVGDEVLQHVGTCLTEAARAEDVVARVDGGQFAVLIQSPVPADTAMAIGERLLAVIRADEWLRDLAMEITVSVGVGWAPEVTDSVALLAMAQQGMQRAKSQGGGRVVMTSEVEHPGPFLSVVA